MQNSITIQHAGFYTTIQDKGRSGFAHLGVPESGTMDKKALQLANALINNLDDTAVIEYTLVGPTIHFNCDRHFVITGGITDANLDTQKLKNNKVYLARKGQLLKLSRVIEGCRGYLSVAGGILSKSVLDSRSMYVPITQDDILKNGMTLPIGTSTYGSTKGARIKIDTITEATAYFTKQELSVFKGPEYHLLESIQQEHFKEATYTISKLWNRMAVQLEEIIIHTIPSIQTGAVLPGTVQLTPAGRIIILMRDCQTTGGYPRIFQLSEKAINLLAQKKQGDSVSFLLTD
ncbi:biotin-dependent carboxyltransferase family protein [Dokdonia sp.]|uniref:5-oxoprolinase subunit C family protein n=1 Tax=Dokdonia sp. TaxID=2024995 RepID=UPI0032645E0F